MKGSRREEAGGFMFSLSWVPFCSEYGYSPCKTSRSRTQFRAALTFAFNKSSKGVDTLLERAADNFLVCGVLERQPTRTEKPCSDKRRKVVQE
jgi:hypothetical protein